MNWSIVYAKTRWLPLPSLIMDSRAKTALLVLTLILNSQVANAGTCWKVCGCSSVLGVCGTIGSSAYKVYSMVRWIWDFAIFLKDPPTANELEEVPKWLIDHPPPIGMKYKLLLYIIHFVLDKDTLSVFQSHENLKNMLCDNEYCEIGKEVVAYFGE